MSWDYDGRCGLYQQNQDLESRDPLNRTLLHPRHLQTKPTLNLPTHTTTNKLILRRPLWTLPTEPGSRESGSIKPDTSSSSSSTNQTNAQLTNTHNNKNKLILRPFLQVNPAEPVPEQSAVLDLHMLAPPPPRSRYCSTFSAIMQEIMVY